MTNKVISRTEGALSKPALLGAGSALLIVGFALFPSTGTDDAYISYWPAQALARFGEIFNYNGERVEQSSSLLFVMLLAALRRLSGIDVVLLGYVLPIFFGLVMVWAAGRLAAATSPRTVPYTMYLTASSAPIVCWSFGGMETTLYGSLALLLCYEVVQLVTSESKVRTHLWRLAALVALYEMVRPEASVVLLCALVCASGLVWLDGPAQDEVRRRRLVDLLLLATAALGFSILLAIARRLYFGRLWPEPVLVKAALSWPGVLGGLEYVFTDNRIAMIPCSILALVNAGLLLKWKLAGRAVPPAMIVLYSFCAAHISFVIAAGGDWMGAGRFLVPVIPILTLLALDLLGRVSNKFGRMLGIITLLCLSAFNLVRESRLSAAIPFGTGPLKRIDAPTHAYWFETRNSWHYRDLKLMPHLENIVGNVLREKGSPVVVMTGQAGLSMFYLQRSFFGDVHLLDVFGLSAREFGRCEVFRGVPKSMLGLRIELSFLIGHLAQMRDECQMDADVIFAPTAALYDSEYDNIHDFGEDLKKHGYRLEFVESSSIENHWFETGTRELDYFVAVKSKYGSSLDR